MGVRECESVRVTGWREAGPPNHLDDVVNSDQYVVDTKLSLWQEAKACCLNQEMSACAAEYYEHCYDAVPSPEVCKTVKTRCKTVKARCKTVKARSETVTA